MEQLFHLRCFTENVDVTELVEFLKTETEVLVIVSEVSHKGHRPHIHATIKLNKAVNTFRDHFRKSFPMLFGNKSYSLHKVRDYESNIKYCLKGTASDYPDVLYTSLGDADVKQYYNEYWHLQDKILASKKEKQNIKIEITEDGEEILLSKPKSKRAPTWSEKLTKTIIEEYPLLCEGLCQYHSGLPVDYLFLHDSLVSIILKHMGKSSKNLDEFILIRLYNAQLNAIIQQCGDDKCKESYNKGIAAKILHRTF